MKKHLSYFPYTNSRVEQERIMEEIASLQTQSALLVEAPTGSGKTIAVLSALLERRKPEMKIVVVVKTMTQINPILREWAEIIRYQLDVHSQDRRHPVNELQILPLLGKKRLCDLDFELGHNTYVDCKSRYFAGLEYWQIRRDLIKLQRANHRARILKWLNLRLLDHPTLSHFLELLTTRDNCPYYNTHAMLADADIVITTYPYLEKHLMKSLLKKLDCNMSDLMIVIDEAHNLVLEDFTEIAVSDLQFICQFISHPLLAYLINEAKGVRTLPIEDEFGEKELIKMSRELRRQIKNQIDEIFSQSQQLQDSHKSYLSDLYHQLSDFFLNLGSGRLAVTDTTISIERVEPYLHYTHLRDAYLRIYQSGTLTPIDLFAKLLGLDEQDRRLKLTETSITAIRNNPQEFRALMTYLTSQTNYRNPEMFEKFAKLVVGIIVRVPRHVLLLAPSYDFAEEILPYLRSELEKIEKDIEIICEQPKTPTRELHESIIKTEQKSLILGNQRGKVLEGNEWTVGGHSVVSTVIMTGLSTIVPRDTLQVVYDMRSEIFKDEYYGKLFDRKIPIYVRAIQALGRTIRSEDDKGALIILDSRVDDFLFDSLCLNRYNEPKRLYQRLEEFFK